MRSECICTLIFLSIYTVTDLKSRKVYWPLGFGMILLALILHLYLKDMPLPELLLGLVPGIVLGAVCLLGKGAIGAGDCIAAAVCGAMLGPEMAMAALTASMLLACIPAVFLLIRKGRNAGKERLPYMPFLLAGQILCLILSR